ncbi:MAG: Hsp20/alpha crystallin family protein [Bacteroidia bacterium]
MKHSHFFGQHPLSNVATFFDNVLDNTVAKDFQNWFPTVGMNIKEKEDAFEVEIAAPGMKKENFQLEMENQTLKVSAKVEEKTEEAKETYTRKEFMVKSFERTLRLTNKIDTDAIAATYTDGILTIRLPKRVENKEKAAKTIVIE